MNDSFVDLLLKDHLSCQTCPPPSKVDYFFDHMLQLLFSDRAETKLSTALEVEERISSLRAALASTLIYQANQETVGEHVDSFFDALPEIRALLLDDARAIEAGDPAAQNLGEVIRTYPGFYAIAAHRIAHQLWKQNITTVPRMITEIAHTKTGVDIHPGAQIGEHFCIDHGTGIVIGATTQIGNHVKIYQGVTLGALSVRKEDASKKRHPTIEDHCIIYAGATILGGETIIGKHSVIGGNVWITKSVSANSKIYYQAKIHDNHNEEADFVLFTSES